jgi:ethanolamine kinase
MHRWICALPIETEIQQKRKAVLEEELQWLANHLGDVPGIDGQRLVFGHCDLLSANVIIQPTAASLALATTQSSPQSSVPASPTSTTASDRDQPPLSVAFIDYEYATPVPVAFDIANHFAEWGGFDCDFSVMPTRSQRRNFLSTYLQSYNSYRGRDFEQKELEQLMDEVDQFRGAPGFYWGIWALIQATISQIDFDYANYAEVRLSEYWAWKNSLGEQVPGKDMSLREKRWAQEE